MAKTKGAKRPQTSKKTANKRLKKPVFKFNIQEIVNNRRLEAKRLEQTPKLEDEFQVTDELCLESLDKIFGLEDNDKPPVEPFDPMHFTNYNIPFGDKSESDLPKLCLKRLRFISVERNEIVAKTHFNFLKRANWSPLFEDVQNILCKWPANFNAQTNGPSSVYQMEDYKNIPLDNFNLVLDYFAYCILKNNKKYSVDEMLTIAKYAVTIHIHICGRLSNTLHTLFSAGIETALKEDDDPAIIAFAQELYLERNEDELMNMVVVLFLPFYGEICKKIYIYLTYKLFKSFLGKTDNTDAFPSSINDWFVQDLVDKNYFIKNPKVLSKLVQLLEHVVFIFDLYKEDKKLEAMYHFLHNTISSIGLSDSMTLINILDIWRLSLFRLNVNRHSDCIDSDITIE